MALPQLQPSDIESIIPNCRVNGDQLNGGQKIVFPCSVHGENCAVKFVLLNNLSDDLDGTVTSKIEALRARVEREITIMRKVDSPNIVKMGSVDLTTTTYNGQNLLYYSEEWIDGQDLAHIIQESGKLPIIDAVRLCRDMVQGISELWALSKVHRDIKPQNIIRRASDGVNVLLDLGLAFDLDDKSLTQYGCVPGTKIYFSPEQLDIAHKRDIDFRSDLFSLGIVLYQALIGNHPFYTYGMPDQELFLRIMNQPIIVPNTIDTTIPKAVSDIVCRLLNKQPNGRYRKCSILLNELDQIISSLEVQL